MQYRLKITGSSESYHLAVVGKSLYSRGSVGERMNGTMGLTWDGNFVPPTGTRAQIESVISEVMADGIERTITVGEPEPREEAVSAPWRSSRGLTLAEEMDEEDSDF